MHDDNASRSDDTSHYLNESDPILEYRENPLIGALGPVKNSDELTALLSRGVENYSPEVIGLPAHLRFHAVCELQEFFQGQAAHFEALRHCDVMLRRGYVHRNRLNAAFRKQAIADIKNLNSGTLPPARYTHRPLLGAAVVGPPGTGKTSIMDMAMAQYPAVVHHVYNREGVHQAFTQVTALKITMFADASLKAFAVELFEQLAALLGDPDLPGKEGILGSRCNASTAQPLICRAIMNYNVGMIVVDDTQHMASHAKGHMAVLNYFIRLQNCIGIPIVLVGTDKTEKLLATDMSAGRRFLSPIPRFSPFVPKSRGVKEDGPWEFFLKQLGLLRYVREDCDLVAFSDVMYELTGGVPDLAVKLWTLTQTKLIGREIELVDDYALKSTAASLFNLVGKRILELRGQKLDEVGASELQKQLNETYKAKMAAEAARLAAANEPESPPPAVEKEKSATPPAAPATDKQAPASPANPKASSSDSLPPRPQKARGGPVSDPEQALRHLGLL